MKMTTDQINGIETNSLTVGQVVEQLNKKAYFEQAVEGFKINIGNPKEVQQPDAQELLDGVERIHLPLFFSKSGSKGADNSYGTPTIKKSDMELKDGGRNKAGYRRLLFSKSERRNSEK